MNWKLVSTPPPHDGTYLVVIANSQIEICQYCQSSDSWSSFKRPTYPSIVVTHWMDLPELP